MNKNMHRVQLATAQPAPRAVQRCDPHASPPAHTLPHFPRSHFRPTRNEVNTSAVTHWFRIDKARRELGYRPRPFDLDGTVQWFRERGYGAEHQAARIAARRCMRRSAAAAVAAGVRPSEGSVRGEAEAEAVAAGVDGSALDGSVGAGGAVLVSRSQAQATLGSQLLIAALLGLVLVVCLGPVLPGVALK